MVKTATTMKKLTLFATLCALLLGACTTNELDNITPEENTSISLPDLTAAFADDDVTKTYVENGKYLRWHEDDRITAFFGNTLNRQYKFKGKTGANSGTFSLVPSGELGTGNDLEAIYAVYPYDERAEISDEGVISLSLPAVQNFAEESFGRGANTMIAVTAGLEDTFLGFKNACGYLKLKLYNEEGKALRSLEIKGNNGEKIAGSATATMEFGGVPTLTMGADATTSVTLDCGEEGIELGTTAETATELWIVLPATTFEGGITITATDIEGGTFEKSTTKPVAITRNDIQPMAALEAEFVVPTPETWKIYYTATAKVEPYDKSVFGANYVSNEWDETTGEGVITFDGVVTKIGEYGFQARAALTSVAIPSGVTVIGDRVFWNCSKLESVTIPEGVTSIGNEVFAYCSSMKSITIPQSVTSIGKTLFLGWCDALEKFEGKFASEDGRCLIVDGVINSFAHAGLTEYAIPDGVTAIGERAFTYCTKLTSITIPDSVTEIGWNAFYNCSKLESIDIPDSVTLIHQGAFEMCSLKNGVTLPKELKVIYSNTFKYCDFTSITIPESVIRIDSNAFAECSYLTSVAIPDSVASVGEEAFYNCSRLENVTIGSGVTSIGNNAFDGCSRLASVYCKPTEVPTGGKDMFQLYNSIYDVCCVIYVPAESKNLYKEATNWSCYVPNIVGYDYDNGVVIEPTVSYTITLNDDWQKSDILNPNPVLFDGVYESFSNHGTSGNAFMYIDIEGYTNFKMYICCSAHSSYYVQVSQLDAGLYGWYWPDLDDATKSKAYLMGGESSGTSLSNYKLVEFDNIDGGKHRITVMYSKAGSQLGGNDRAYVLIPKEQ